MTRLLMQGDRTIPAAARVYDRFAERRPGVTCLRLPGAGHIAPFTHAPDVIDSVTAHLLVC